MSKNAPIDTRIAAIVSLLDILKREKPSDFAIQKFAEKYSLTGRDRAFLSHIVFGTLKNLSYLDYILLRILKDGKFPSYAGAMALRIGGYQIAFGDVPIYAAVDTTVEAMRSLKAHHKEIALINAVLKKFIERWKETRLPVESVKLLAIRYSHPEWIVLRWVERYGIDTTEKMLIANNADPPRTYRINTLRAEPKIFKSEMIAKDIKITDTVFDEYFELQENIPPGEFAPFVDGLITVQDAAFAIPAKLLMPNLGEATLEIGSAPGGKTSHIVELLSGDVENFYAVDISTKRNLLIKQNFERMKLPMPKIITADGALPPFKNKSFDKILIDAPCTAWGIVRRHPEIRWHRKTADFEKMSKIQRALITSAFNLLKPGGLLIFSTCTTEPEENQGAVNKMQQLGMELLPIPDCIPKQFMEADGFVARTMPYRDSLDGSFSIVAIRR